MSAKKLNRRQARWSLTLSHFDFTLLHWPGRSMGKPDSLSRQADHGDGRDDKQEITLLKPELFTQLLEEVKQKNCEGYMEEATGNNKMGSCTIKTISTDRAPGKVENSGIRDYCRACNLCICTKIQQRAPTGELQPLPIPTARWEEVSMDFIVELPESAGYDAVMVTINRLSKQAHFIPTHTTITALGTTRLFLVNVWRHHSLPLHTISDRGTQFIADFMRELWKLLGIEGVYSTAYHPQTDGQTERMNQELEQFLQLFIKTTLKEARAVLNKTREEMTRYYNTHRTPAPAYKKLSHQYLGPWTITVKVSDHAYRVQLPMHYARVHPIFNVTKLLPAPHDKIEGWIRRNLPPPELIEGVKEYEGYGYEDVSWEDVDDVHALQLVEEFYHNHPEAAQR
ncbi:hypothetical protein AX17_005653 [Amanita inopinata Kibby_2008]|nr:hypothetical protein AX17_005653 [Amanita inopinata Kibby_2008]